MKACPVLSWQKREATALLTLAALGLAASSSVVGMYGADLLAAGFLEKREHSTVNGVQLSVVDLLVLAHVDPHSCPRVVLEVGACACAADGAITEP